VHLYPNVHFDLAKFPAVTKKFWEEAVNRKEFFDSFARNNQFDPLLPRNWYSISIPQIHAAKGAGLLKYYSQLYANEDTTSERQYWKSILARALASVYPSVDFDIQEFTNPTGISYRRRFFDEYAKDKGFDPLFPDNWYYMTKERLALNRGSQSVLGFYNGSVMNALVDAYPNITWMKEKFLLPPGHWKDPANQKEFFDSFARDCAFDPEIHANWRSTSTLEKLKERKSYRALLSHFGGSIETAIASIYHINSR